ncbi:hypothetical protein NFI96_019957 [Prochilodus magdalenae]|nr:hypothetical protein NFI96_019957 [Prochilodus magdalenae]
MRILQLGCRYAGKSSAGNTILNREEFELKRTAQCVKRQGEVAGRHITVVEAPGWWSNVPVEENTELLKQEIVLSVSLCPPGPHAVLLIICVDIPFKRNDRSILEGYLKLLTDRVWSHTIVLFTCGDCLGDIPIEQHIESEGEELQWLVKKCGNRYHVLNNKHRSDVTQVTELLEKIEEMVAAKSGRHFEMDRKILQEVQKRRRADEERAKERMIKLQKQKESIRSWIYNSHHLSELRIVLLGNRDVGKSSAGNTILNREEFELKRTAQCVKRHGEVAGRRITVVEAPGWWKNQPLEENTELLKQEIVLSVSLCPPGPHAVLLIIRVDSDFKRNDRSILGGYLKLLTDTVWSHTIVLFTCGDWLGDTPIEQHIETEGKELQWLVEKCGNRYHVLNNKNRSDDTQVTELLEKIEEMVAANSGRHFEVNRKILQEVEDKRRAEKKRVKEMKMNVRRQRDNIRSQMGYSHCPSEMRIVLLGNRHSGKSSAGNTILNREEFELKRTAQCVKRHGEVAGRHVTVVEAPGWWINIPVEENTELLNQDIILSVSLCSPGPHAVLLIKRVDTVFKRNYRDILEGYLNILTDTVWSHTIVLFTCGDCLGDTPIEQLIESEGKELQWLVEKCGNRYHVFNNKNRSDDTQVTELLEKIEEMVAANSGWHFELDKKILQEVEERRRAEEKREKERNKQKNRRSWMSMTESNSGERPFRQQLRPLAPHSINPFCRSEIDIQKWFQSMGFPFNMVREWISGEGPFRPQLRLLGPHSLDSEIDIQKWFQSMEFPFNTIANVIGERKDLWGRSVQTTIKTSGKVSQHGISTRQTNMHRRQHTEYKFEEVKFESSTSLFGLENRPSSASSYMSMKKDYSAVSPDPSEVSIKWVWSMDNPGNFSGPLPYDHQRFGLENRPSSASSYMSMKKNYSAVSQCPSEVSMKTDWSMNNPGNFSGSFPYDHQRFGLENRPTSASSYMSMKTEYSAASPVPSEVSIQTDWSMNNPENFSGSLPYDRQRFGLENRPTSASSYMSMKTEYSAVSPVPSEVSIQTDCLMDNPGNFSGPLPYDHQRCGLENRPTSASSYMSMKTEYSAASPVPSEVSIKMEWSMDKPGNFSGSLPYDHQRFPLGMSPAPSSLSIKSEYKIDEPPLFSKSPSKDQTPVHSPKQSDSKLNHGQDQRAVEDTRKKTVDLHQARKSESTIGSRLV